MPVILPTISDKELPPPYDLARALRALADGINKAESNLAVNNTRITQLGDTVTNIQTTINTSGGGGGGGGGGGPAPPVGPFPAVIVDPNGAILGDGTALDPLRSSVDGTTVIITGNQLTAPAAGGGITELTGPVTAGPGSGAQATTITPTGVTPGTYGDATNVGQFTVNAAGQITLAVDVPISGGGSGMYCEPLTDGDLTQPELIFAGGDVIMVCTP